MILFTGDGSASVHAGIPPPGKETPPCAVHAGRYAQQAGGMHPTGMQFLLTKICTKSTFLYWKRKIYFIF